MFSRQLEMFQDSQPRVTGGSCFRETRAAPQLCTACSFWLLWIPQRQDCGNMFKKGQNHCTSEKGVRHQKYKKQPWDTKSGEREERGVPCVEAEIPPMPV